MQLAIDYVASFATSPLNRFSKRAPWELTSDARDVIEELVAEIDSSYRVVGTVAVHHTATVEDRASIKGPAIIGPHCFVAANSLIRGGCWVDESCIVGPGCELKSSFIFRKSKLAHFNFVGDSILGSSVNLEAGSIVANYRNELPEPTIKIRYQGRIVDTGVTKFGALIGDGCKIGANSVIAPGSLVTPNTVIARLALVEQAS